MSANGKNGSNGHVERKERLAQIVEQLAALERLIDEARMHKPDAVPALMQEASLLVAERTGKRTWGQCVVLASRVKPEPITWLWTDRIPYGEITVLDGDPGEGKSTLALDLVARLTRDAGFPHDEHVEWAGPQNALVISLEDALGKTLRPRLEAAGADMGRAFLWVAEQSLVLPDDVDLLAQAVRDVEAKLVVVDPLTACLSPDVNSHHDADVRRALMPLAGLAHDTGAAFLLIRHLNKGAGLKAVYRGGGSIGIVGAARSAMIACSHPEDADRHILAAVKCNLCKKPRALEYRLVVAGQWARIEWGELVDRRADDLVDGKRERGVALAEALRWLTDRLRHGKTLAQDVEREAREAGISSRTLRRAREELDVRATRIAYGAPYFWELPEDESALLVQNPETQEVGRARDGEQVKQADLFGAPLVGQMEPRDLAEQGDEQGDEPPEGEI